MEIITISYDDKDGFWRMVCLNSEHESECIIITDRIAVELIKHGGFEQLKFKEWEKSHLYIYEIPNPKLI